MKSIDIHGKEYIPVNERVKYFREEYADKNGQIVTTLLSDKNGQCIFKADIYINEIIVATGHAKEIEGDGNVNTGSYIENCETSAVGRALGIFGIGIDNSIASADEVKGKKPLNVTFNDTYINFGKHNGKLWTDVPTDYLEWLAKQDGGKNPESKAKALEELENRQSMHDQDVFDNVGEQINAPF